MERRQTSYLGGHGPDRCRSPGCLALTRAVACLFVVAAPLGCTPRLPADDGSGDDVDDEGPNTAPSAPVVSVAPTSPTTTDDLTVGVVVDANDPDGDALTYRHRWLKDGAVVDDLRDTVVPADRTTKGQTWTAVVTADDGRVEGAAGQAAVTIANARPTAAVTLVPAVPTRAAAVQAVTELQDADADAVTATWLWSIAGIAQAPSGDTLPATALVRGQTVSVRVTPNDGDDDGEPVTTSFVVGNALPAVGAVTVAPAAPVTTDQEFTATAVDVVDVDGDEVALTWRWLVNGVEVADASEPTLPAFTARRGQTVTVEVTPHDGVDAGTAVVSAPVIVADTPPTLASATIAPADVREASVLQCVLGGYADLDDDADASKVRWFVNDVLVAEGGADTPLTGAAFARGDRVRCEGVPTSGNPATTGAPVVSATRTVLNSPPRIATVATTPNPPTTTATLRAEASGVVDDDGDPVTLAVVWKVGDRVRVTGNDVSGALFARAETVTAVITPNDGRENGAPVSSAPSTFLNLPPTMTAVRIQLAAGETQATRAAPLTAVAEGVTDPDRDAVSVRFVWKRGTTVLAEGATLAPELFVRGDAIVVEATPNDGLVDGTTLVASPVTIVDAPPRVTGATFAPAAIRELSTVTCTPAGFVDADGDGDGSTVKWFVNDALVLTGAASTTTLNGTRFRKGDRLQCELTARSVAPAVDGNVVVSPVVTVENTPPRLASAAPTATTARKGDILDVTTQGATDDDGDALTFEVAWLVNNVERVRGAPVSANLFTKGESVVAVVRAFDGSARSDAVTATPVLMVNSAPTLTGARITLPPGVTTATEANNLFAVADGAADADGDAVTTTFSWRVGGVVVGAGSTLTPAAFARGNVVTVVAVANDGEDSGAPVTSSAVTIANTPPTAPGITATPTQPNDTDDLRCTVTTASTDLDNDTVRYGIAWTKNGAATAFSATNQLAGAEVVVPASATATDDTWTCTVTADDGNGGTRTATTALTIGCRSMAFNGTTSRVVVSNLPPVDGNAPRSFTAWTNFSSTQAWACPDVFTVGNGTLTEGRFSLYVCPTGADARGDVCLIGQDYDICATAGASSLFNRWAHWGVTFDGSTAKVFLDGVEVLAGPRSYSTDWTQPLVIGSNSTNRNDEFFAGRMGEVRMWDRGLTDAEVRADRNASPDTRGLVGWWNLAGVDGNGRIADLSGNGRHGVPTAAGFTADCPVVGPTPLLTKETVTSGRRVVAYPFRRDYAGAEAICARQEMRLAVPRSSADNLAISGILPATAAWIGVDDRTTEGTFRGSDLTPITFNNFASGEPNGGSRENCVHFLQATNPSNASGRTWNDAPCTTVDPELDFLVCEEPCRSAVVDGRTIDFCSEQATYSRAEGVCAQRGGALVTVPSSSASASLIAAATTALPGLPYWIGLTDRATEGTFRWSDGGTQGTSPFLFNGFVGGEPSDSNEQVLLSLDGSDPTFEYNWPGWTDSSTFGEGSDPTTTNMKTAEFATLPLNLLSVEFITQGVSRKTTIQLNGETLKEVFSGSTRNTTLGLATWKSMVPDSSLQIACVLEGFNLINGNQNFTGVRLGIVGNGPESDCLTPDSFIGIGARTNPCFTEAGITTKGGNATGCQSPNGYDNGLRDLPSRVILRALSAQEDCVQAAATSGGWSDKACSTTSAFACDVDAAPPTFVCGNGVVEAFESCDDGNTVDSDLCNNQCVPTLTQTAFADFNSGSLSPFDLSFGCAGFGCPSVVNGALRLNGDWNVLTPPASALVGTQFAVEFTVVDPQALKDFGPDEGPRVQNGRLCDSSGNVCQTTRLPAVGDVWRVESNLQAKTARVLLNGVEVLAISNAAVPTSYSRGVIFGSFTGGRVNGTVDNLRWFSAP